MWLRYWLIAITGLTVGENGQYCAKINQSGRSFDPVWLFTKNGKIGERRDRHHISLQFTNSPPAPFPADHQKPQKPRQLLNNSKLNNIVVEAQKPIGGHSKHFLCKHISRPRAHHGTRADGLHRGRATSHFVSKWCEEHHKTGAEDQCVWDKTNLQVQNPFEMQLTSLWQTEFRRLMLQRRGRLGRKCEESRCVTTTKYM